MKIDISVAKDLNKLIRKQMKAIDAVLELHKPVVLNDGFVICQSCSNAEFFAYKDCSTIAAIEKELNNG